MCYIYIDMVMNPFRLIGVRFVAFALVCCSTVSGQDSSSQSTLTEEQVEDAKWERAYERQRNTAHSRMPDTMHASTPSLPDSPHPIDPEHESAGIDPSQYRNALEIAASWRPTSDDSNETAETVFRDDISPIVQAQCVNCHVDGGVYQGDRIIFVSSSDSNHLDLNFQVFSDFLADEEDGPNIILNKVRGNNHGGGVQAPAGGDKYASIRRFLLLLAGEQQDSAGRVTWQTLFEGVTMASDHKVLRRAAMIFAGRIPTPEEYATIGEIGLRQSIRNLMTGPEFHEFLIRASNDRLFTDRERNTLRDSDIGPLVDYINLRVSHCEMEEQGASEAEIRRMDQWNRAVQFAAMRAPLELIAYVTENDLPYTEVLTADYVMANPQAAEAFGADTEFENVSDAFEFKPSKFAAYFLRDASRQYGPQLAGTNCERPIVDPGNLQIAFPHAGILNTPVFNLRYPTTATNRNRARSRWTYYHFLGLDIEKSASRTTDPEALADTHNPTYNNAACTVCHSVLDPVAGAFQNYDDRGRYRSNWGGEDALDRFYKRDPPGGEDFLVEARTYEDRQTIVSEGFLSAGENTIGLRTDHFPNRSYGTYLGLEDLTLRDSNGEILQEIGLTDFVNADCGEHEVNGFRLNHDCVLGVPVSVASAGMYQIQFDAWNWFASNEYPNLLQVWVPGYIYQDGDTWYRDMREPGMGSTQAPNPDNSVQWLAQRLVEDDRFAESTVKFWWPALHGSEVVDAPPHSTDADFEGLQVAAIAQDEEIKRLAQAFRTGINDGDAYNLKDLLVEMILSDWFRADALPDEDPVREVALLSAGARRLLTPEELARKTAALTGVQWGRRWRMHRSGYDDSLNALGGTYNILYGGIDSDGNTIRARDMTAVMANVAKSHATEMSCPIVLREMYLLPDGSRRLFNGMDVLVDPTSEFSQRFDIQANDWGDREAHTLSGPLQAGEINVNMVFTNDYWDRSGGDRDIHLSEVRLLDADGEILDIVDHSNLVRPTDCVTRLRGYNPNGQGDDTLTLHQTCAPAIAEFDVPADGTYAVEVVAWASQAGDDLARLAVSITSDIERSAGSRAIRSKLVELHNSLLGEDISIESQAFKDLFDLFVEIWEREKTQPMERLNQSIDCRWSDDEEFFVGILDDYFYENEDGYYRWDWDRVNGFLAEQDLLDPSGVARTWTFVLMGMMMDPRYLHL